MTNFDILKLTLKNNVKEGSTENHIETIPLIYRNAKKKKKKKKKNVYLP